MFFEKQMPKRGQNSYKMSTFVAKIESMKKIILSMSLAAALFSCGNGNEYKVSGTVAGSAEEKLVLQRPVQGAWLTVDTIETDKTGEFEFSNPAPKFPEVLRLGRNGKYIYFPVDSIDQISIQADTSAFDTSYRLAGTVNAVWMMQVDSISRILAAKPSDTAAREAAKRQLAVRILEDPSSVVAYYTVNKIINSEPLFSINNKADGRVIGAVANAYHTNKPNDPRTELLTAMFYTGRRQTTSQSAPRDTIYADQTQYIEIDLIDKAGRHNKLSDVAGHGKVVLLNFTTYLADESPALNALLAEIYRQHAAAGFEIYQVGYDENEFNWKNAAKNLPWTTVYDPSGLQSPLLLKYNIGTLPAIFIINRKGEIVERITDINKLKTTVAKYI